MRKSVVKGKCPEGSMALLKYPLSRYW